jgi:hypothetical protein
LQIDRLPRELREADGLLMAGQEVEVNVLLRVAQGSICLTGG